MPAFLPCSTWSLAEAEDQPRNKGTLNHSRWRIQGRQPDRISYPPDTLKGPPVTPGDAPCQAGKMRYRPIFQVPPVRLGLLSSLAGMTCWSSEELQPSGTRRHPVASQSVDGQQPRRPEQFPSTRKRDHQHSGSHRPNPQVASIAAAKPFVV